MAAWADILKQRAAAAAGGVSPPVQTPIPPAKPVALLRVVRVDGDGTAEAQLITCPMCRRPLDGAGCCWKCIDRLCMGCKKKWTGSAFVQLCRPCEVEWRRREGMPL